MSERSERVRRRNFEGFRGYWPAVAADPSAPPRDRAFARWLAIGPQYRLQ